MAERGSRKQTKKMKEWRRKRQKQIEACDGRVYTRSCDNEERECEEGRKLKNSFDYRDAPNLGEIWWSGDYQAR